VDNLTQPTNPLKAYFRKPGIWIKLPSQGQYYKVKPADLNGMGEIPVYPMTAKDELMMKNADALLNGSAVKDLILSCAPSITDPESMPSIDLDAVLVAIRHCTYGNTLPISVKHNCENAREEELQLDLNTVIGSITTLDTIEPVELSSSIRVYIRPVTVKNILTLNWVQYEQLKNLQIAEQRNVDEKTKVDLLQKSYNELTKTTLDIVSECVDTVLLPDGVTVTDAALIKDWISDLARNDYKLLEKVIMSTNEQGVNRNIKIKCSHCGNDYETTVDLNPTTFFE
jgi:hypothetical protein